MVVRITPGSRAGGSEDPEIRYLNYEPIGKGGALIEGCTIFMRPITSGMLMQMEQQPGFSRLDQASK